ncbi:MAG: Uma2 family endonuclease [Symploca sp. SIO1C4]|uniref:Uma2 family endonuclease n=1 Tax=Symploca sp. SIO1C4 TaxID=2607765 RepID=A0A6B3NFJ2_9CYAN|nr:Uma2 family endonuclease [Symploca sp. SIO1C4]
MVKSPPAKTQIATDTWVKASWDECLALTNEPQYTDGRCYYNQGYLRMEMSALGSAHGQDNTIISTVIVLYASLNNIRLKGLTNTSFRKTGLQESQPDLAFYIGNDFSFPPRTNAPVDVEAVGMPNLVVEIGASSFDDDLGLKRLLYEQLGVQEYWVVNVAAGEVIAFAVADGGSRRISESQVLVGLGMGVVEEALQRSQSEDDGAITRWLISTWSGSE